MYLLTANLCIYSQPIYWIFRSPWQLMPSFSTESLNQWGPLAFCRYLINVLTRDEWGWVFVTGRAGRDGAGRGTYCLYQLIEIICYTRGNLDWHCRKLVSQIYSTFIVMIVIMLFSVVILFQCGFPELEIFERVTFIFPRGFGRVPHDGAGRPSLVLLETLHWYF